MHAYLLIGSDEENIKSELSKISSSDVYQTLEYKLESIEDSRELIHFTSLKVSKKTLIVIRNIEQASIEAQNAFLKSLEEPQEGIIFALTAPNASSVLETITSRCQVIFTKSAKHTTNSADDFIALPVGNRLKITSKIKNRDEALQLVNQLLQQAHQKLIESGYTQAEQVLQCLKALKANGNIQLHLTNLAINI